MKIRSRGAVVGVAVAVTLFVAAPAALAGKPASQPTVQFKSGGYGVSENVSPVQIAVERKPKGSSTVHFNTDGGTATGGSSCIPGVDFVAVADALVTFSDQALVTVPVTICNDVRDEANETVIVQLSNPSSGTSLTNKRQATLTITDDDPTPSLTIHDASVDEGDGGGMGVTLSAASSLPVSFTWSTADGTATTADVDYEFQSGSVAIPPGQLGTSFSLSTEDDVDVEGDETFTVVLANPVNASVADGNGTMTIVDNDTAPPDTTAPVSTSATIADNDGDHQLSNGDVITIVFDEPMNEAGAAGRLDYGEHIDSGTEADYVYLSATTLQITAFNLTVCGVCPLGGNISAALGPLFEDLAGNLWVLEGDVTLEDPSPPDTTAPTSTSATVADNDGDHNLSVGDVIIVIFDETMNTALFPDIEYNGGEHIDGSEADYVWTNSTTLQITINSMSYCPNVLCGLGNDISSAGSIEDLAGNPWALAGDVTLEDPDTTAPTSTSATIADNDSDNELSVGDVITIRFDEALNQGAVDSLDALYYGAFGAVFVDPSAVSWPDASTFRVTLLNVPGDCYFSGCPLGGDIVAISAEFLEDLAGNDWALSGDVTL